MPVIYDWNWEIQRHALAFLEAIAPRELTTVELAKRLKPLIRTHRLTSHDVRMALMPLYKEGGIGRSGLDASRHARWWWVG